MPGNLTLKQMRYVATAGRLGSIAAAAKELSISQSSITSAIDVIEAELGFDIFMRVPAKGLHKTRAGTETLKLVDGFLAESREFESELYALGGAITGSIRLACFATAASIFLPSAIKRFQADYPNVQFELVEGDMDSVIDYLDSGAADVAFTYEEVTGNHHTFDAMVDLPHYALVNDQDDLARRLEVSLADLQDRPMINLKLHKSRQYYPDLFKRAGIDVRIAHTSSSVEMIRTLVASGFGFSILNARPFSDKGINRGITVLPVTDPIPARRFGIVTQARQTLPRSVMRFIECCQGLRNEGLFEQLAVREVEAS
ncbi:LysR family transcriptional regulator [uncultured Tateyamaria sp.]|uniref:LysR family transcriptional regulator n=1 Tax=uncultured Tateyamaria sp. TaxID=455651 RepID=UPI00261AC812|nr:LysR family transcriptional regulator [uncultured Tateyamaria sp.]